MSINVLVPGDPRPNEHDRDQPSSIVSRSSRVAWLMTLSLATCAGMAVSDGLFPTEGLPDGGSFVPPGTLFDNGQANGDTSIGSQDGDNAYTARAADDFILPSGTCPSGQFSVARIRMQLVRVDGTPQPFGLELYDASDAGTTPDPIDAISPIASFLEADQVLLGPTEPGQSLYAVTFDTTGLVLDADTRYWLSGFGAGNNFLGFNAFLATSDGAPGELPNGVFINPGRFANQWTRVELLAGGPPLHFGFAIDGVCQIGSFSDGFEGGNTNAWDVVVP